MKFIEELEMKLNDEGISRQEELDSHFNLAACYLNINKQKCFEHAEICLQAYSEEKHSEEKAKYLNRILKLAETGIDSEETGKLFLELGDLYRRSKLDTAYFYYDKALQIFEKFKSLSLIAESYSRISFIYNKQSKYHESEEILDKAIKLSKENNNMKVLSKCYTLYGEIYYYRGTFEKTLDYYLKSLKLDDELGDVREISKGYNNIGTVYYNIREFEKAEEYFAKALEMKLKLPDKMGLAFSYNNLGAVNFILKRYEEALVQYQKSLAIREELNDVRGQIASCSNIGGVYFDLENTSEAIKWFNRAYELSLQVNDKHNAALVIGNIANTQKELGDYDEAVKSAQIELKLAIELEELPLQYSACKTLWDIFERMGDLESALEYYKEFKYLSDEIYNNDSEKRISEIKAKYDVEKKEREAEIHRLKNVALVEANKLIQKKNEELQAYKDDLLLINKILTHDIANDLAVIQSAIELYRETSNDIMLDEIEKRTIQSIGTIREQRSLVSSLDSIGKLKPFTIPNIFGGLATTYQQVDISVIGKGSVLADEAIYSVFENLTNNAIIHGKATEITINVLSKDDFYEIHFADNGTGIPSEIKSKVFLEGFSYGKSGNTGIGLHIVRNTIERYGGTIVIEDNKPRGTVFIISLKKDD